MRRIWKRIAVSVLAVMLVLGTMMTAQAASLTNGVVTNASKVTITNTEAIKNAGEKTITFHAYKIVQGVYTQSSNSLEYTLTDWAQEVLGDTADAQTIMNRGNVPAGTDTQATTATQQNTVLNTLAGSLSSLSSLGEANQPTIITWTGMSSAAEIESAALPLGAYLVTATAEDMTFLNMMVSVDTTATTKTAANEWELKANGAVLKGKPISVSKEITDADAEDGQAKTVQIGDTVTYEIYADVPHFPENADNNTFQVVDTPQNIEIVESSVVVAGVKGGSETALVKYDSQQEGTQKYNYEVSIGPEGVLTVDFTKKYEDTFFNSTDKSYYYDQVKITYSAKVLESAALADGTNKNSVKLVYGHSYDPNSNSEVPGPEPKVYTYGINVTKYGETENDKLSNTVFHLAKASAPTTALKFKKVGTVYKLAASQSDTAASADMTTGEGGILSLAGLDAGTEYILSEAKAPAGYSLNGNTLTIKITAKTDTEGKPTGVIQKIEAAEKNGTKTVASIVSSLNEEENVKTGQGSWTASVSSGNIGTFAVSLTDTKIPGLPSTGGAGTVAFTIVGVVLMVLALVVLFVGKKKRAERR